METNGSFPESLIGNRYYIASVDGCSRYCWIFFAKMNSHLTKKMDIFEKIMPRSTLVKYLRCENSRERQLKLQKMCKKEGVTLEYTKPRTP